MVYRIANRKAPAALVATALGVGSLVLAPLAYLLLRALQAEPAQLGSILFRAQNLELFLNTLWLVAGVVVFTTLLALPLAWLTTRSNLRGKRLFTLLFALPVVVPGYVGAYALLASTGPGGLLEALTQVAWPRPSGYWGSLFALTLFTYPYLFLNLRTAFLGLDPSLEESARSLGVGGLEAFGKVVLPQLRPALYAGWLLVGLHALGDFGVVSLMRYPTFSYAVYLQYSASFDRIYAAWLALMLLSFTVGLLYLESRFLRGLSLSRVARGASRKQALIPLGAWRPWAYLFAAAVVMLSLVGPVLSILFWTRQFPFDSSFALLEGLYNSARASLPAALLATLLALPVAYLGVRYPSPFSRMVERTAYLGFATPPLAFALALIFFSLRGVPALYQTLALLVLAYALHFLAEAIGPVRAALYQTPPKLEEAARSLGSGALEAFLRASFPLIRRGVLASVALVFLSCLKELPLTFLLSPVGYNTLATRVWGYTSEAMFAEAAPFALLIVLLSGLFMGMLLAQDKS